MIGFLREVFEEQGDAPFLLGRGGPASYRELRAQVDRRREELAGAGVGPGAVVAVEADFGLDPIALFLALAELRAVFVPLTRSVRPQREEFLRVAEVEFLLEADAGDLRPLGGAASHAHYATLRERGHPGLVLFSSGSTGAPKAAVHDLAPLLEKFHVRRHRMRTIPFLLYDHIGGVNTLLYTLSNGGALVLPAGRDPDAVAAAIAEHGVQLLPTTPTFLNLLLLSEAHRRHDLGSLELVTYGTEAMPEATLRRLHEALPGCRLLQTYGLSELGILRSRSRASDSLWVKLGGEGFRTRVRDGVLQIQARSAMLGYLNAPSPFTEDGWFDTQDRVEVDGEYFRILGRDSDLINVGGLKVYPTEVESVLLEHPGVGSATVYGEPHPLTGNIVCAQVTPRGEAAPPARELRAFCRERLERFKVPVKVRLAEAPAVSARFKKVRPRDG